MNIQTNPLVLKVFIIGPIGDKYAEDETPARTSYEEGIQLFEEVIVPACTAFGLEVTRADMISHSGEIPEQIFRQLRDCPVVIADLTGANPNVMYELGLRHTTGKVTIQIGEKDRLPFDVAAIRTIMFKRTAAGLVQARKDLSKALAANLDTGGDPVTATRIWFERPNLQDKSEQLAGELGKSALGEEDTPGFLELLVEMEVGIQSLVHTLAAASAIIKDISGVYTEASESIQEADARGGGAGARLTIAELTATKLDEQASRIEVVSGEYARTVDRIEPGIQYLLERLADDPTQLIENQELTDQILTLCEAAKNSIGGSLAMRDNALELGKASRSLRRVAQRLSPSFKRFADESSRIASWINLIDKIPKF